LPKASKTLLRGHFSAAGTAARCAGAPAGSILSPVLWSPCVGRAGSSSSQEQGAAEMWPPKGWAASRRALAIHGLASLCSGGTRQVRGLRPPRRELGRREPVPPLNSQNTPHGGSATCCACCGCRLASFSATYTRRGRQPRVKVHQRDRGFKSSPTFTAFTITKRQRSSFQLTKIRVPSNVIPGVVTGVNAVVARRYRRRPPLDGFGSQSLLHLHGGYMCHITILIKGGPRAQPPPLAASCGCR